MKWIHSTTGKCASLCLAVLVCAAAVIIAREFTAPKQVSGQNVHELVLDGPTTQPGELPIFWSVPDFSYVDQEGQRISQDDLRGRAWITDFIFTQCTSSCPTMTAKMVILQRQLADANIRFVSFSVDPAHDTPDVLKQYASRWNAEETRWLLLSTDEKSLQETTKEMNVTFHNTGDADNPIIHSNLFFLIDAQGRVRGIYNSGDPEAMDRLRDETMRLTSGQTGASTGGLADNADGKQIYTAMGCAACHNDQRLGPSLLGVFGHRIALDGGGITTADTAYLRESIIDPAAKIVAGYRPTMPSYRSNLTDDQVTRLVDYVGSLEAPSPLESEMLHKLSSLTGPTTAPFLAVDVVCKMNITVTEQTQRANYEGKTYYFCSETCLEKFNKEPQKYALK